VDQEADKAPTGAARVLTALRVLSQHPDGVSLVELSRILRSPKSSVLAPSGRCGGPTSSTRAKKESTS
jgi:hypothetical protein